MIVFERVESGYPMEYVGVGEKNDYSHTEALLHKVSSRWKRNSSTEVPVGLEISWNRLETPSLRYPMVRFYGALDTVAIAIGRLRNIPVSPNTLALP